MPAILRFGLAVQILAFGDVSEILVEGQVIMPNIQPIRPSKSGLVQKCPKCGNIAPLFAKGVFSQWREGMCLRCALQMLGTMLGTLKAFTDPLSAFLVKHGVVEVGKPLPKGERLAEVLGKMGPVPEAKT